MFFGIRKFVHFYYTSTKFIQRKVAATLWSVARLFDTCWRIYNVVSKYSSASESLFISIKHRPIANKVVATLLSVTRPLDYYCYFPNTL